MRKKIGLFLMTVLCAQVVSIGGYAADMQMAESYAVMSEDQTRSTDVIVTKFRVYNGVRQYRRWNETKKCWVDSKWINMP